MNQLMEWFGLFEAKCRTLTRYGGHEPTNGVVWFIGSKMSDTHEVRGHEPTNGVVWFIRSKMSDTHKVRGP